MVKKEVTNEQIMQALNEFATSVDKRFDAVEYRLDRVETRLDGVEKRLDKVDSGINRIYDILDKHMARIE